MDYVKPELLILIPVLSFIGAGLKKAQAIPNRRIPLLLGCAGMLLALLWVLSSSWPLGPQQVLRALFAAATQGILCAGCSVYAHQLIKQRRKEE